MQKIAVIIPSHNRKELILETIPSISAQVCPAGWAFQIVIVDDGSTDKTFETVCERYQLIRQGDSVAVSENQELTILRTRNQERGAARNVGAQWAFDTQPPDWFLFFDSDDILVPDAFAHFVERLGSAPSQRVVAAYGFINTRFGEYVPISTLYPQQPVEGDISSVILKRPVLPLGATFIRAEVFKKLGGFSEDRLMSGSEDWQLLVRTALEGPVLFIPEVIAHYRQHQGNTSSDTRMLSLERAIESLIPELRRYFGENAESAIKSLLRQAAFKKVGACNSEGKWKEAGKLLGDAIINDRSVWTDLRAYRLSLSIGKAVLSDFKNALMDEN